MSLPSRLVGADALLEDTLGLLDEQSMQINAVALDTPRHVVLPEDVLGCLSVIVVHLCVMRLALVGELLGLGAVARGIGLVGLLATARLVEKSAGSG